MSDAHLAEVVAREHRIYGIHILHVQWLEVVALACTPQDISCYCEVWGTRA